MSPSQPVQAASLPYYLFVPQIEFADDVSDAYAHIRHSIEMLVGIVPDMPGALSIRKKI